MDNLIFPLSKKEAESSGIPYPTKVNKDAIFPQRLRELRAKKGVSQQIMANDIGVTKSTISLYEQGDNVPDIKTFVKIADYYNVSYDYLLGASDVTQRDHIDIAERTGLSDEAINKLAGIKTLSEEIIDESDDYYGFHFASRRDMRHTLQIINTLLSEDNIIHFCQPILNYIDSIRRLRKRLETMQVFEELKEKFGEDVIINLGSDVCFDDIVKAETLEDLKALPNNEWSIQLEKEALKEKTDFEEWRVAQSQKAFAIHVADEIMDRFEEMPHEI